MKQSDLDKLLEKISVARGPFFLARLNLRVKLPPPGQPAANPAELLRNVVAASRDMGFDPLSIDE
jgi:hypothetical protein